MFGDRPVRYHDHGLEHPSLSRQRGVRIGGWVDLAVVGVDGTKEYRHLDLWAGRPPDDQPLDLAPIRVAGSGCAGGSATTHSVWCGPTSCAARCGSRPSRPTTSTPWSAGSTSASRPPGDARPNRWRRWVTTVARADTLPCAPSTRAGPRRGCARADLLPGIVHLSPTSIDRWDRCGREWRNADVLRIPRSDADGGGDHGSRTHGLLRLVHDEGSCRDTAHVHDVLARHGVDADPRVQAEPASHVRRCPEGATSLGHEVDAGALPPPACAHVHGERPPGCRLDL